MMKLSAVHLALAVSAAAVPTDLQSRAPAIDDFDILNFALTLEHLENAFYSEGLAKFSREQFDKAGYTPRTRFNVREISYDESTHVTFLTSAIKAAGGKPVKKCKYDFGLTTVDSFMDLASVLEGVGVTAYLGAAAAISNKDYLTAAGSILTVESRHNAYIRDNHQPGPRSPFPAPFDTPLTINEVYTLASAFIVSCPKNNPKLPATAYPALATLSTGVLKEGDKVMLQAAKGVNLMKPLYAAFAAVTGPVFTPVSVGKGNKVEVTIPKGVAGQSYVVLTNAKKVTDKSIVAGPGIVEIQSPYTYPGFPM